MLKYILTLFDAILGLSSMFSWCSACPSTWHHNWRGKLSSVPYNTTTKRSILECLNSFFSVTLRLWPFGETGWYFVLFSFVLFLNSAKHWLPRNYLWAPGRLSSSLLGLNSSSVLPVCFSAVLKKHHYVHVSLERRRHTEAATPLSWIHKPVRNMF